MENHFESEIESGEDCRWDLGALYSSFDDGAYERDIMAFDGVLGELSKWAEEELEDSGDPEGKIAGYLKFRLRIDDLVMRLTLYPKLKLGVDSSDSRSRSCLERLFRKFVGLTRPRVRFVKWLSSIPDAEEIIAKSTDPAIADHTYYLTESVRHSRYMLEEKEEEIITRFSNTGSSAWDRLQTQLTSNLMVKVNLPGGDRELALQGARNLAYHEDPEIRKAAYEAELKAYPAIEDSVAACLNGIKGEVLSAVELRGYESALDMTLKGASMQRRTLDALLGEVRESLPVLRRYFSGKARHMGHSKGLPFYDVFAPLAPKGKGRTFTVSEAKEFVADNFRTFSPKLADLAVRAFREKWIDFLPRKGKEGGAWCCPVHPLGESRLLLNFSGSLKSVVTMAHELGHAYHNECLRNQSPMNASSPMPLAETASIFCEGIVKQAALKEAGQMEAFDILESDLSDIGQKVVDIFSRFLFEDKVFAGRRDGYLGAEELCRMMLDAQKEVFGDSLDQDYLHRYMWLCKSHYYSAGANYYNFPYAFGILFAKGLYREYLHRGPDFVAQFETLLASTGRGDIEDVAKAIGIDVSIPSFWRGALELVARDIERFESFDLAGGS